MLDPWAETEGSLTAKRAVGQGPVPIPPVGPALQTTFDADEIVTSAPPVVRVAPNPPPAHRGRVSTRPLSPSSASPTDLDLSSVEKLADLPNDARVSFARRAVVKELARNDEASNFALALVLEGSVEVAATIVDSPAFRLDAGAVLRGRGTIHSITPIRLVAATDHARVATWDERAVADAFRSCPWIEDDLRIAGNRTQALVGVTMGALGERLDPVLRGTVTNRMRLRVLAEYEVFARAGAPIPGLLVVGGGELELVGKTGVPTGAILRAGDFLFPNEVLRAAPAPNSVRAAKGGAIILVAERGITHELLVTCPPLLELFADGA
ncbi:MAG: hypothetical protein ABSC94_09500 [Polyangiaceae bacterium]